MTVIAKRTSDSKVFSFVKGGDVVILERLTVESMHSQSETIKIMDQLAA